MRAAVPSFVGAATKELDQTTAVAQGAAGGAPAVNEESKMVS